jgi:hypothetical protein
MVRLSRRCLCHNSRSVFANRDKPISIQQPQQAGFIEAREGSFGVGTD